MKSAVWLSHDLGVSGDYQGMCSWLENQEARECGSSLAFLKSYEFEDDHLERLRADIGEAVSLNRRSRIYMVFHGRHDGRPRGRYVVGRRKAPPWTGFGDDPEQEFDED